MLSFNEHYGRGQEFFEFYKEHYDLDVVSLVMEQIKQIPLDSLLGDFKYSYQQKYRDDFKTIEPVLLTFARQSGFRFTEYFEKNNFKIELFHEEFNFNILKVLLIKNFQNEHDFINKIISYDEEFYLELINGENGIGEYDVNFSFIMKMKIVDFFDHFIKIFGYDRIMTMCEYTLFKIYFNYNVILNIFINVRNKRDYYKFHKNQTNFYRNLCLSLTNVMNNESDILVKDDSSIIKIISAGKFTHKSINYNLIVEYLDSLFNLEVKHQFEHVKYKFSPKASYYFLNSLINSYDPNKPNLNIDSALMRDLNIKLNFNNFKF